MSSLLLCHRFFQFSLPRWNKHWSGRAPTGADLQALFRDEIFPRRCLRVEFPRGIDEARALHEIFTERDEKFGVRALTEENPEYPAALRDYVPPERRPAVLYLRGRELPPEAEAVAVVGTRCPSPEGAEAARSFSAYFSLLGIRVVSGLARGVDTLAHWENLANGTVGVLGSSVTEIYPAENTALAEEILHRGGSLLSPYPTGQVPLPANFPQRNEIIAALTTGTLVVEGAEKSGAAITGKQALAMGKEVVVLAGDFRSAFGRGAIRLQQAGATLAANEEEAVQALYARLGGLAPTTRGLNADTKRRRSFTLREFCNSSGMDVPQALAALQEEILKGTILRVGADRYKIRS